MLFVGLYHNYAFACAQCTTDALKKASQDNKAPTHNLFLVMGHIHACWYALEDHFKSPDHINACEANTVGGHSNIHLDLVDHVVYKSFSGRVTDTASFLEDSLKPSRNESKRVILGAEVVIAFLNVSHVDVFILCTILINDFCMCRCSSMN